MSRSSDPNVLIISKDICILNLRRLPARLTVAQAAAVLGVQDHEIPILVRARLLMPLGNPAQNGQKYFAACQIEQFSADPKWLARATAQLTKYWQDKNQNKVGFLPKAPIYKSEPSPHVNN